MADQSYTYEPGSGLLRDKIRLLIPDRPVNREKNPAAFSDQEIADIASMNDNDPKLSAACACEIIAMTEAKRQISVSINSGMSISRNTAQFWLQRGKQLREETTSFPWEFIDAVSYGYDELGEETTRLIGEDYENE